MKILSGRDTAGYLQERHAQVVAGLERKPHLAIVRMGDDPATNRYLKVKARYGEEIGATVTIHAETPESIISTIEKLGKDASVTGIIVQLPLTHPEITPSAVAAVPLAKDVDGLAPGSLYEAATPKAALWLLAAHNIDLAGHIVVVGQGKLVGKPLADRLEASGLDVTRCDINTKDLKAETIQADILFTGTGQEHLITSDMVKPGAVLVDTGAPKAEFHPGLYERTDLGAITPNPGGVGPMTVVSLFDNLLIAAQGGPK